VDVNNGRIYPESAILHRNTGDQMKRKFEVAELVETNSALAEA